MFVLLATAISAQAITSQAEALLAINISENTIKDLSDKGIATVHFQDILLEAKQVLEQAKYAEILRGDINSTTAEKNEARQSLRLISWNNINYSKVLIYTLQIEELKIKALLLSDKIGVAEKSKDLSDSARQILSQAKTAFAEERYTDTEKLLNDLTTKLEKERVDYSTLRGLKIGAQNFFQRYWLAIIISIIVIFLVSYVSFKIFEKKIIRKKIAKMKTQEKVINNLIKRTQEERFKQGTLSGLVYNIRMTKYKEKLDRIAEELPVLESKLKKKSRRFK